VSENSYLPFPGSICVEMSKDEPPEHSKSREYKKGKEGQAQRTPSPGCIVLKMTDAELGIERGLSEPGCSDGLVIPQWLNTELRALLSSDTCSAAADAKSFHLSSESLKLIVRTKTHWF